MSEMKYEDALLELQKIVEEIENPNTSLQDVSKEVKRAMELVKYCKGLLRAQEESVKEIIDSK